MNINKLIIMYLGNLVLKTEVNKKKTLDFWLWDGKEEKSSEHHLEKINFGKFTFSHLA